METLLPLPPPPNRCCPHPYHHHHHRTTTTLQLLYSYRSHYVCCMVVLVWSCPYRVPHCCTWSIPILPYPCRYSHCTFPLVSYPIPWNHPMPIYPQPYNNNYYYITTATTTTVHHKCKWCSSSQHVDYPIYSRRFYHHMPWYYVSSWRGRDPSPWRGPLFYWICVCSMKLMISFVLFRLDHHHHHRHHHHKDRVCPTPKLRPPCNPKRPRIDPWVAFWPIQSHWY